MGCDIHITAEIATANGYEPIRNIAFAEGSAPFDWRSYGMFGFLADVRNYSAVTPIAEPRGLPNDLSAEIRDEYEGWGSDAHTASWISISELTAFDFNQKMEDRRVTQQTSDRTWDGGCTAKQGDGATTTYKDFLGQSFINDLKKLQECGADRVVFWFDC